MFLVNLLFKIFGVCVFRISPASFKKARLYLKNMFDSFFDATLGKFFLLPEPWAILGIAFILTLITTLVYKYMTNQEMLKSLKTEIKEIQNEMKSSKDNPDKMMQAQKLAMEKNMVYMKHSLKPVLVTFVPFILIFGWLRIHYTILGDPSILFGLSWIWVYLIFSILISIALRKLLKVV